MADGVADAGSRTLGPRTLGVAFGVGAGAVWGGVFLAPVLVHDFTPLQLAAGRYLAYGVIALALLAPRWAALRSRIGPAEWRGLAWLSLMGNALYYVLLATAVQLAGVAVASLVIGFLPVTVSVAGARDRDAIPFRRLLPSLLLTAAGTACIGWRALGSGHAPGHGLGPLAPLGFLCAVGALLSWTAYAVGNSRWLGRLHDVSSHDWNLLLGVTTGAQALVLAVPAFLLGAAPHAQPAWLRFVAVSTGVAVLASILGNAMWNRMSRLLPLSLAGQMILFETLFALLYGFLWERRAPTPLELAAMVLVSASVLTCVSAHRKPATRPPEALEGS